MEDDCWVGRGEFNSQKAWRMTAGWRVGRLTASRGKGELGAGSERVLAV